VNELPNGRQPKFKIGDLVRIRFTSDFCPTSSYVLKDGMGLISEILFYECKNYGVDYPYDDRESFYLIEYKILPSAKGETYRYVSEQYLESVEEEK
tara:strand:- start:415 stop:702 length:288 start_codon:yes stop_codon:yes gene_type:complete